MEHPDTDPTTTRSNAAPKAADSPNATPEEPEGPTPEEPPLGDRGPDLLAALRDSLVARVPDTLRGARGSPGRRGWQALVVAALIAALVSGGVWWRSRSVPTAVPPVASSAAAPTSAGAASSGTASAGTIVVDVAGKVRRPGIVQLPAGSRVHEAIRAAGGVRRGADTTGLNLARKLVDGEQIVVGKPPQAATGAPGSTSAPAAKIDLNSATIQQLDELPGVGPVLAQRILDYRAKRGTFTSVEELKQVSGIGPARYADIAPKVLV